MEKYHKDIFLGNKIQQGIRLVKTEYSVICTDDDYINPNSVKQCANFLSNNPDYSSAHGLYFNHRITSKLSKSFIISPLYDKGQSSRSNSALKRIENYLNGENLYYPFYAVHKTQTLKSIWDHTVKYIYDWDLLEVFPCCLSLSYGKMKILPILYSTREVNDYDWISFKRKKQMYSKKKINSFIHGLVLILSEINNLKYNHAYGYISKYINSYKNTQLYPQNIVDDVAIRKCNMFIYSLTKNLYNQLIKLLQITLFRGCYFKVFFKNYSDFKKIKTSYISSKTSMIH